MEAPVPMQPTPDDYSNRVIRLRWMDDRLKWSNTFDIPLGPVGATSPFVWRKQRMGMYRTRQYELVCSDTGSITIIDMESEEAILK